MCRGGELVQAHPLGGARAGDKAQRFQMVERGNHRARGRAGQTRDVLGTDQASRMAEQKDQHIPVLERGNPRGDEPVFYGRKVRYLVVRHMTRLLMGYPAAPAQWCAGPPPR